MNERKECPCFEVDCVINFWDLAHYAEVDVEEYFYKLFPWHDFENADYGRYMIINVFDKIVYEEDDEVRKAWEEVQFYIQDCGYHFYDKVMMIF